MGRRKTKKKSGCLGTFFSFFIVLVLLSSIFGSGNSKTETIKTSTVPPKTTVIITTQPTQKPTATPTAEPSIVPTAEPTATPTATPTEKPLTIYAKVSKAVNIRQEPNADSKKTGSARQDEMLIVTQPFYVDSWHQIEYNGETCYVSAKYCDIVDEAVATSLVLAASMATQEPEPIEDDIYIGNKNTKKFHEEYCSSVDDMKEKNKVTFTSRESAINKGYVPCKRCNP